MEVRPPLSPWSAESAYITVEEAGYSTSLSDFCYHVPNGIWVAGQPGITARIVASLKKQGMKKGVSDIVIALPVDPYHGAYLELKRGPREVTAMGDEQKAWLTRMRDVGYYAAVAAGLEDAILHVRQYISGVKAPALPWT